MHGRASTSTGSCPKSATAVVLIDYAATSAPTASEPSRRRQRLRQARQSRSLSCGKLGARGERKATERQELVKMFARTVQAIEQDPAGVYEQVRQRPDVPLRELEKFRRLLKLPAPSGPAAAR